MEYIVYSDESYITAERYRSIAALSFPNERLSEIDSGLRQLMERSNVSEFKWEKLRSAKYRFCAQKIIKFICDNLFEKGIRIDVIIWDTQDSRHKVKYRDDDANFERMFFHLLKNLMTRREYYSDWYIYPDERLGIDWNTIRDCLSSSGKWRKYFESRLWEDAFSEQFFNIRELKQIESRQEPCCQVADFFAGIAVFSKNHYGKYKQWFAEEDNQMCLFKEMQPDKLKISNSERPRYESLKFFNNNCKKQRLGVSLDTNKCLSTPDPNNPINFWHYVPQHPDDKAPVKVIV